MLTFKHRIGATGIGLLAMTLALITPTFATAQADEQEILPEWEDAGVIDIGEYESPTFGYTLEWDDDWLIDEDFGEEAVVSEGDPDAYDSIQLRLQSSDVRLSIGGYTFEDLEFETAETAGSDFVDYWDTDDIADIVPDLESVSVIESDSDDEFGAILGLAEFTDGLQEVWYREVRLLDDGETVLMTNFTSPPEDLVVGYEVALESFELDRDPLLQVFDVALIEDAAETIDDGGGTIGTSDSEYLETVAENFEDLDTSVDRFFEVLELPELTDQEFEEVIDIIDLWIAAEDEAKLLEPDAEYEDIHDVYLSYTAALGEAGTAFTEFIESEVDSPEYDEALDAFGVATGEVTDLGIELEELLADAPTDADPDEDEDNPDPDADFLFTAPRVAAR